MSSPCLYVVTHGRLLDTVPVLQLVTEVCRVHEHSLQGATVHAVALLEVRSDDLVVFYVPIERNVQVLFIVHRWFRSFNGIPVGGINI